MSGEGTVTLWIHQVKAGDHQAAAAAFRNIWQRYSARMFGFAQRKLQGQPRAAADEDDVLQSVFRIAFQRARDGKLDHIDDREDLWKLLIGITAWKARDQARKQNRQKRGGGKVQSASAGLDSNAVAAGIDDLAVTQLTPEVTVMMAEELERLLGLLGNEDVALRVAAELKMDGADNREIQDKLACSPRTVERKLRRVREIWEQELRP